MKSRIIILSILLLAITLSSCYSKSKIRRCFISFTTATNFTAAIPDRLPKTAEKKRTLETEYGEVEATRIDGYRILYNNDKNAPFVNVKVELSAPNAYEADQIKLLDNLKYLNTHSPGMETEELIELNFNGYKISGLSRGTIETGVIFWGTFIMFPGNGVTVYFYFNNLKPDVRNFENLDDYKEQRDRFLAEYTKHLTTCSDK